jgi:pimeloyl-ACP methyl ester carboxylesterase
MVPSLFIIGDKDLVYSFAGAKEYIHGGGFVDEVPNLKEIIVLRDVGHFLHQEKPELVNTHILNFFKSFHAA